MDGQGSRMSRLELEHMQLNEAQTALEVGVVVQAERTRLTHALKDAWFQRVKHVIQKLVSNMPFKFNSWPLHGGGERGAVAHRVQKSEGKGGGGVARLRAEAKRRHLLQVRGPAVSSRTRHTCLPLPRRRLEAQLLYITWCRRFQIDLNRVPGTL